MKIQYDDFMADQILKEIKSICDFCKRHNIKQFKRPSIEVDEVIKSLGVIQSFLEQTFAKRSITVQCSIRNSMFPKVPWIVLLPPDQTPQDGIYVPICFGREGNGFVCGCAESVTSRKGLNVVRRTGNQLRINVDGISNTSKYNDSFVNPLEVMVDQFDINKFLAHLDLSLNQAFAHLNDIKS